MTIVSTTDFRANQTKFLQMVDRGEHVVLKSRRGSYRLTPVEAKARPKFNLYDDEEPYTMEELNARIDEAEAEFEHGEGKSFDEMEADLKKQLLWLR